MRHVAGDRSILGGKCGFHEHHGILRCGPHGGGLHKLSVERWPCRHDGLSVFTAGRERTYRHQGIDAHPVIGIGQLLAQGGGTSRSNRVAFGREFGGVFPQRGIGVIQRGQQDRFIQLAQIVEAVERMDAGKLRRITFQQRGQRSHGGGRLGFIEQAVRRGAGPAVRMIQHFHQPGGIVRIEREGGQGLGVLVLNAVDAGEVMVAIRTRGGIARAVGGSSGVVVNGDLVVKVHQINGAIRADAAMDWAKPVIGAGDELGLFAAIFLAALIGGAFGIEELMMKKLAGRLAHEE